MAIKTISVVPNPILTNKTQKVGQIDSGIKELAKDLIDTVRVAKDPEGAGLAAPQLGVSKRVCVVRNFFEDPAHPEDIHSEDIILINPKIVTTSQETEMDWEGCLSVPDKYGLVERYKKVKLTAKDLDGNILKIKADGFFARTIQHEIDHLEGVLFTERVVGDTISQKEFDKLVEEGKI